MAAEITPLHLEREWMTLAEFARLTDIGLTVAYELAQKNQLPIPAFKIGKQWRLSRIAYDAWVTAQHADPGDAA